MKRSKGFLSGNTRKLKRKEKITATRLIKDFEIGERVSIDVKGGKVVHPHPRYRGRVGVVKEKRGNFYVVEVKDGGKIKQLICSPLDLVKIEGKK